MKKAQSTFSVSPKFYFYSEDLKSFLPHKFESITINIPAGYDRMLRNQYGDYMKPVKAPTCHGDMIYDCNTPYEVYIKEHQDQIREYWQDYGKTKSKGSYILRALKMIQTK